MMTLRTTPHSGIAIEQPADLVSLRNPSRELRYVLRSDVFQSTYVQIGLLLVISGCLHLFVLFLKSANWEGPLSLRKPGLFGISGGLTVWSIGWVISNLKPRRFDRWLCELMAWFFFMEVALITIQQWRGVASHFNHETEIDAAIEKVMLGLIVFATVGIVWLTIRSTWLRPVQTSMAIAIRGGMWLLTISCAIGFVVMYLGELNVSQGMKPEIWGRAGVLKYPHGAALHAIQLLPLSAWVFERLRSRHAGWLIASILSSQILFLAHAVWQTFMGRTRLDLDIPGGLLLAMAGLFLLPPILAVAVAVVASFQRNRMRTDIN